MTLIIMAAGIGSRFGEKRIKQFEPVGTSGELLMDYSVYDALKAGFDRVVFVIRRDIEDAFRKAIGDRLSKHCDVSWVFQEKEDIPVRRELAANRVKPWGTGQAVLAARAKINGSFAVINADDFYGYDAFRVIAEWLKNADNSGKAVPEYAMCGFMLENTLSDNGEVTRGVCKIKDGYLTGLEETKNIARRAGGAIGIISGTYNGESRVLSGKTTVSMNMWGFTADYMNSLETGFTDFLTPLNDENLNSGEFLVPIHIGELVAAGKCRVRALSTNGKWFGMTYAQDVEEVKREIRRCNERGDYPDKLFAD